MYDISYIYLFYKTLNSVPFLPLQTHNMSHTKVHSQCTVPFLWEEIPGVPKSNFVHRNSFNNLPVPPDNSLPTDYSAKLSAHEMNINIPLPPPCPAQSMHKRSSSFRALVKRDDDPFVAALKECTKGDHRSGKAGAGSKIVRGVGFKGRKGKFGFSCMFSDDHVTVDNMVRLATLPPLSRRRSSPYGGFVNKTTRE